MYKLIIEGFQTKKQVKEFVSWYEGQGEQDAAVWFECRQAISDFDCSSMMTDMSSLPLKFDGKTATFKIKPA